MKVVEKLGESENYTGHITQTLLMTQDGRSDSCVIICYANSLGNGCPRTGGYWCTPCLVVIGNSGHGVKSLCVENPKILVKIYQRRNVGKPGYISPKGL